MTRPDHATHRLYLIDGTAQLFRAYFAIHGLTNDAGLPTNAVYGFTTMLRKLLDDESPEYCAVAFDLPGKVFRHEQYPDYKANRPPTPEDLNVQRPWVKKVCDVLGVPVVERPAYEADDLIATYARAGVADGLEVTIVGSDKDLLQLVAQRIDVLNPTKEVRLDSAGVVDTFGVAPEHVCDVLGLQGDSVDNIPGVPGVGGKSAVAMVATYGGIESILQRAGRFVASYAARDAVLTALDAAERGGALAGEAVDEIEAALTEWRSATGALMEIEADAAFRARLTSAVEVAAAADLTAVRAGLGPKARAALAPLRETKKALKALDKGSMRKVWTSTHENADQARMSRELAVLCDTVPDLVPFDSLRYSGPPDRAAAQQLFATLGFQRLTKEFDGPARGGVTPSGSAGARRKSAERRRAAPAAEAQAADLQRARAPDGDGPGGETDPVPQKATVARGAYRAILTVEELVAVIAACRAAGRFALDTETNSTDPQRARLVGLSLAWETGAGVYIPVGHRYLGVPDQLSRRTVQEELGPLLADPTVVKLGQNWKYDQHVLRRHGLSTAGWGMDTMVAAFLLDSGRASYSMDALAEAYLDYTPIAYSEVAGKGAKARTLDEIDVDVVTEYAAEDADVTLRLAEILADRLDETELRELYDTVDGPVLPILVEMETHGIRVDPDVLVGMSGDMSRRLETLRRGIHELAGTEFNVDSPKQLREVLYQRMGLKTRRKTAKSGVASTDAATLEQLAEDHPIAARLLEYRELAKLKGTYIDALPRLIHPETGRVHTSYHATGAATGRLSSSDPNLQNIPARTEEGRRIRGAFVPDEGYVFLASDYSQVELRVLAHMAEDEELTAAFQAGEDIHRYTAARVFGVEPEAVTGEMRTRAKAVNFGILYGMSESRLARDQGMSRDEAREFIAAYFDRFSRVRDYIEKVREDARRDAAVRTLFGRIRWFPQLHRKINRGIQEQALRAAVNTTIQGTAADLMKLAMLRVDEALKKRGDGTRMLLQVHDELLLEVPGTDTEEVSWVVREAMEQVHPLRVPLKVDQKVGESWLAVT